MMHGARLPSNPRLQSVSCHFPSLPPSISSLPNNAPRPLRPLRSPGGQPPPHPRGGKPAACQAPWHARFSRVLERQQQPTGTALVRASPSPSPPPPLPPAPACAAPEVTPAAAVVREFYDGINRRDLASVSPLISDDCVYEDLIFSRPFVGRKAILEFFKKFTESVSSDLRFVIDDISCEDSSAIGVTWHLDWRGKPFPFSKGCSFYRLEVLDGKRQIVYGRDCVEPAAKPGDIALVLIRGVTSILERFPQLADRF